MHAKRIRRVCVCVLPHEFSLIHLGLRGFLTALMPRGGVNHLYLWMFNCIFDTKKYAEPLKPSPRGLYLRGNKRGINIG